MSDTTQLPKNPGGLSLPTDTVKSLYANRDKLVNARQAMDALKKLGVSFGETEETLAAAEQITDSLLKMFGTLKP